MERDLINVELTKKDLRMMRINHAGRILSNLTFIGVGLLIAGIFGFVVTLGYYLILLIIAFLTLFIIFMSPAYMAAWGGGNSIWKITSFLTAAGMALWPLTLLCGVTSIILLSIDKKNLPTARIVLTAIATFISIIALIIGISVGALKLFGVNGG